MSYIPDCRTDENYNEKNLNKDDKLFVKGFDYCADTTIQHFFNNIDVYEEDFLNAGFNMRNVDIAILIHSEEKEYGDEDFEKMSQETRIALAFLTSMKHYVERDRDNLIVNMIDEKTDKDFEKNKANADKKDGV